jgi:hypothetical protein
MFKLRIVVSAGRNGRHESGICGIVLMWSCLAAALGKPVQLLIQELRPMQ